METCALSNLLDILKEQNQMNHSEDERRRKTDPSSGTVGEDLRTGSALNEILDRLRDLDRMDFSEDETGTAAWNAFHAINYLHVVTSHDTTAQRALNDICKYIIHLEHKDD